MEEECATAREFRGGTRSLESNWPYARAFSSFNRGRDQNVDRLIWIAAHLLAMHSANLACPSIRALDLRKALVVPSANASEHRCRLVLFHSRCVRLHTTLNPLLAD